MKLGLIDLSWIKLNCDELNWVKLSCDVKVVLQLSWIYVKVMPNYCQSNARVMQMYCKNKAKVMLQK